MRLFKYTDTPHHGLYRWCGNLTYLFSYSFRCIFPYICIVLFASLLSAFLLRNVYNLDFPLSGEFLTSPFYSELFTRSVGVWDKYFGLGFSNTLGSTGMAPYTPAYSGVMWITNNILNTLFQGLGAAYFFNLVFSISLLSVAVYWVVDHFKCINRNITTTIFFTIFIVLIVHSSDFFLNSAASAGRFIAGQGLFLIAFMQYRQLLSLGYSKADSASMISLAITLATLLFVFNPYFLSLMLLIGIQGVVELTWANKERQKIALFYTKILIMSIVLMVLVYGYVFIPPILSSGDSLISGSTGRHDSPMQYPLVNLLRFFNNPTPDNFGLFGTWLQFVLAIFGIVLAMFSPVMRRWVRVDLLCIATFIFLAKGSAPPLPEVNQWLHVNIPFLRLMGSGYPYLGVVYTLLIYYLIYGLTRAFNFGKEHSPLIGVYVAWLLIIVAIIVGVFRNKAYLSGDFGGRVQSIEYPTEYYTFKKTAEQEMQLGRAYYFPDKGGRIGMDYVYSPAHTRPMDCCYELPFSSVFPISIDWANFNKYSGYYGQTMDFLVNHLQSGDEFAHVFSQSGTRYAVFDLSLKKTAVANYRTMAVRDQVRASNLFVFKPALSNPYIEVYENMQWQPAASRAVNLTLSTDDPNVFLELAKSASGRANYHIVVSGAITLQEVKKLKDNNLLKNVLLYNSDDIGLMLDLIRTRYELKPDANTMSSTGASGWYTNNQVYQTQVTGKYGGRFIGRYSVATTSGDSRTTYYSTISADTNYKLFIRAMVSPDSGRVLVHVNNESKQLDLRSKGYVGLQWFDLGEVAGATNQVRVEIEALDSGYYKRIDVISLVPNEIVAASSALISNLFGDMNVEQIEKPDYLEWKKLNQHNNFNRTIDRMLGEKMQIMPKTLMVTNHHFMLYEDFDRFDEAAGQDSYNLVGLRDETNPISKHNFPDRKFLRIYGGSNPRFNASGGTEAGIYSLSYELVAYQSFINLTLNLNTAFVTADRSIQIFVSDDGLSWVKVRSIISDVEKEIELGDFVRGKKKVFLKISYTKLNEGPVSILLTDLRVHGVAGRKDTDYGYSEAGDGLKLPLVFRDQKSNGQVTAPYVALIDKNYNNNWRMGNISPFHIGYGFAAFPIVNNGMEFSLQNDWENKYRMLIFISAAVYLLLWIVFFINVIRQRSR